MAATVIRVRGGPLCVGVCLGTGRRMAAKMNRQMAGHRQKKMPGTMAGHIHGMACGSIVPPFPRTLFHHVIWRKPRIRCAANRTDHEKPPAILIREFRHDWKRNDLAENIVA